MTESSANKLLNGDVCHRTSCGKKSGRNGFAKNQYLFQQQQKYRSREKVRPSPQYHGWMGLGKGRAIGSDIKHKLVSLIEKLQCL